MPAVETVEDIIPTDSMVDHIHGAAVHGTILYEDGKNGSDLPVLHNIVIENIIARGGGYGIFLKAFDEVPVTGLTLRNIRVDGMVRPMRSMGWKRSMVDDTIVNRGSFPRPDGVRILGAPVNREAVKAEARARGGDMDFMYSWQTSVDGATWRQARQGEWLPVLETMDLVWVTVIDHKGNTETSHEYRAFPRGLSGGDWGYKWQRLYCRGMWRFPGAIPANVVTAREQLAGMLLLLVDPVLHWGGEDGEACSGALRIAVGNEFIALGRRPWPNGHMSLLRPDGYVTRRETVTIAMQACDVNYRNASCAMPACADATLVSNNYGTNVVRALYFGFMSLESDGCFKLRRSVTIGEVTGILSRVTDFAST